MDVTGRESAPQPTPPAGEPTPRPAGRVLLLDSDELLLWSMATFLTHWLDVLSCRTAGAAERALRAGGIAALIVSDQLPVATVHRLLRLSAEARPPIRVIVTVLGTADGRPERVTGLTRLEKPFALRELARLLGVAEDALTSE